MASEIFQATHGSVNHPLKLGDMEIPAFVLEDGRRVLLQTKMVDSLGMAQGGNSTPARKERLAKFAAEKGLESDGLQGGRLARFVAGESLQPYVSAELLYAVTNPIQFRTPTDSIAFGYEATVLVDICEVVLKARQDKRLNFQQEKIAKQCEILVRGFARVGIIALVDEVTGYQDYRARQALEEILGKFISEELLKWVKTFPDEFYRELFRLRGLSVSQVTTKRPSYLGHITNDIVYERLAPGVLDELKKREPSENGRRRHKLHQHLTEDVGHPKLREHLASVIVLMKASTNYAGFYRLLQRALPKFGEQMPLPLDEE